MSYTVVAEDPQLPEPQKIMKETAGEALTFHWANLRMFGRSRVLDENGHEVDQNELARRAQEDGFNT